MEAVITYIKGYPNKTKLTYQRIEDDVVERIVNNFKCEENNGENKNQVKKKNRKLIIIT